MPDDVVATGAAMMLCCSFAFGFIEAIFVDCDDPVERLVCGSFSFGKSLFYEEISEKTNIHFYSNELNTNSDLTMKKYPLFFRTVLKFSFETIDLMDIALEIMRYFKCFECSFTYSVKSCLL